MSYNNIWRFFIMQESNKRIFFNGSLRNVSLYFHEPEPADSFLPEEDKSTIVFQFSISLKETKKADFMVQLKKDLTPRIKLDREKCKLEYRVTSFNRKNYFQIIYHVYDDSYGAELYSRLKIKYFE